MIEFEEALARILAAIPAATGERIVLGEAHGRVLARQVMSPVDLPPFDNSAMDGYAVRADDLAQAKAESPVRLRLCGKVAAGESFKGEIPRGSCVRLFTGSPMPFGTDVVVMQEDTLINPEDSAGILCLKSVKPWENVRLRGTDIKRGARLAEAGERLSACGISLLAAVGIESVWSGRRPKVGLVATGSELKEPGQQLADAQIYESNRPGLAALVRGAGALPAIFPLVADSIAATRLALEEAFNQCDAVVTTGGASVGEMDFMRRAFEQGGGDLQFWRVAIKPGRPFMFGRRRGKLFFGLPGNPVSAFVTFLLLVRPALLRWQGGTQVALPAHPATLAEPLANPGERRHFLRVKVDGTGTIRSAGFQASHALSSLAAANGLLELPPKTTWPKGTAVQVMRWE